MHKTQAFVRVCSMGLNTESVQNCESVGFFEMAMPETASFISCFTILRYFSFYSVARECKKRLALYGISWNSGSKTWVLLDSIK